MDGKISGREKLMVGLIVLLLVAGAAWRVMEKSVHQSEPLQAGYSGQIEGESEPELITVHIVGAVHSPGVYQLPQGSRVYELVEVCGGFCEDADREAVNQARPLFDGEQIIISRVGEQTSVTPEDEGGKININNASVSELTALPGIGTVRAEQIVAHREKYGPYTDVREIMDVSGIGEKTFENIADRITVY
ncbi:MAG: ComEA family DNA-binding protein [Bacillota bacterium]|nr:ComEA family DNA-binding protein [Bacillota bacterium]